MAGVIAQATACTESYFRRCSMEETEKVERDSNSVRSQLMAKSKSCSKCHSIVAFSYLLRFRLVSKRR